MRSFELGVDLTGGRPPLRGMGGAAAAPPQLLELAPGQQRVPALRLMMATSLTRLGGCSSQGRQRAEALAEKSVEIAQAMVPLAGVLARGGG